MLKKNLINKLQKIRRLDRRKRHPLINRVHKKHKISKKTLFYTKEYGKGKDVKKTIIKESLRILLLASVISSLGGLTLNSVETLFLSILPLVILLPALNDVIGSYATIISSRFSEMLYEGTVEKKWWKTFELKKLLVQILILAVIAAIISSAVSLGITYLSLGELSLNLSLKIFLLVVIDILVLTNILFFVAIFAGLYFYKKKEDPNNFLIPITTSVADFSNMLVLTVLILILF